MTGLDSEKDVILEIYCIVTNGQLEPMDEGWGCVVNQPFDVIDQMVRSQPSVLYLPPDLIST